MDASNETLKQVRHQVAMHIQQNNCQVDVRP
jgi:hypothetical protein